jgi:GT2 family glycosyltransferase
VGRSCVVVLNWNGLAVTRACLRALADAKVPDEDVLLVDNASTDGSPAALGREFPGVRQLVLATNTGYAGGNDAALDLLLAEGRYAYALVLNNDAFVTPGLLARLERALDEDARVAVAQPKVLFPDGTIENAGYTLDRYGVTHPRGRGKPGATSFPDDGWFYASGACMLVRLAALREVGAFDATYFCYHEDVDLAWRLRLAGWEMRYCDDVVCYHDESTTAGRSPKKIGAIWKNRWRTLLKDAPLRRLPPALALTAAVAVGSAVKERDAAYVGMYAKSVWQNVRGLRGTLRERKRVQALRRVRERDVRARMRPSVEWAMIRGRLD